MFRTILFRVLLCGFFALPAWGVASRPVSVAADGAATSTGFQLYAHLESWDRQLRPLDPASLAAGTSSRMLQLGSPGGYQPSTVLASRGGSTIAAISYRPVDNGMTEAQDARAITVRVIDARTGIWRPQFHPAVPLWVAGISDDGTQIFGWRESLDAQQKPEWDVLSASDGSVVRALQVETGCCGTTVYDAATQRLYVLQEPPGQSQGQPTGTPATPSLVAYDLRAGHEIGHITLEGILAGSITEPGQAGGAAPVFKSWTPGFALSPDGRQIAVLDGENDRLDLIDARQVTLTRSMTLTRPQGMLERLASALGLTPATASAKEWLGVQLDIQYSPDGRRLYVTGRKGEIGADAKWTVVGLGLRLVDVASGQVMADAFPNQWVTQVVLSPDGSALYSDVEPAMGGEPMIVARQDPTTLAMAAKRAFYDAPELYALAKLTPAPYSWLQAWPMAGHDPQRTSRSPAIGPVEPNLLFQRKGLYPALAGPDGTIYALSGKGLATLDDQGRTRWTVWDCCGEGAPVLAPNGMVLGTGFHTRNRPAGQEDTEAIGITPIGAVAWRIQPFGVLKGAIPLVTPSNVLYLPIVGPAGADAQGLNVMSADGKLLQKLPVLYNLALAPDGTMYGVGNGLQAFSPAGTLLWQHPLKTTAYGATGPVIGSDGTVYVGAGKEVDAFGPSGTLLWRHAKGDGALALALRSDGVLLVAGQHLLDAVQPDGKRLWQVQIGSSRGMYADERPSLIVDADGTAYVGSGDGLVRAISSGGGWLSTFAAGGRHDHFTPGIILDASGRLLVSGTDGIMRIYSP